MFAVTAILSCVINIRGLFKSTKWRHFENVKFEALSARRDSIMDLIYYGPLFRSAIPVKDQKGFVRAITKRGLGSINKQNQRENWQKTV